MKNAKSNAKSEMRDAKSILQELESISNPKNVEGMARFGINPDRTFGIQIPVLRKMAKEIGINHKLALELWDSGYHEAKILAGMVADIQKTDEKLMDRWVKGFDSWDVCDQTMLNLFWKHPLAIRKAVEWSKRRKEFEKRAGFALMACFAFKSKNTKDSDFDAFIPCIISGSSDERNYVKKAVNWALRQIGKRNKVLNKKFIQVAEKVAKLNAKPAKWIAGDALRELKSEAVQRRLNS